jgi:hypothetical protein
MVPGPQFGLLTTGCGGLIGQKKKTSAEKRWSFSFDRFRFVAEVNQR